jgi:hypothetical protein
MIEYFYSSLSNKTFLNYYPVTTRYSLLATHFVIIFTINIHISIFIM